jgi:energy-coupling factor transport system permease protein
MKVQYDLYVRQDTWLHRLDPRVKFLFVVEASIILFLWPNAWVAAGSILLISLAFGAARVPPGHVIRIWRMMGPLMMLVFVLTAIFGRQGNSVLVDLGPLPVTWGALEMGTMLALRLLALAMIIFLWLFTTDQAAMLRGFRALRLPYEWGLTLALALRFLPIFAGLFDQVRDAQQARGLDLTSGGYWRRLRAYRPVLVSMVIIALRQSQQLGWALEARALGAHGVPRSTFRPLSLTPLDRRLLFALGLCMILAIILRLA